MPIQTYQQFVASRPELRPPIARYAKDLLGWPFQLECDTPASGTTAIDLTLQQAWYHDAQVRALYNVADSSSAALRAVVHIEMVAWMFQTAHGVDTETKDDLLEADPYLEIQTNGITTAVPLNTALMEPIAVAESTATTTEVGQLKGVPYRLSDPVLVNLENGSLQVKFNTAPGAAYSGRFLIFGALTEIERAGSWVAGGSCGNGGTAGLPAVNDAQRARDFQRASDTLRGRLNRGF